MTDFRRAGATLARATKDRVQRGHLDHRHRARRGRSAPSSSARCWGRSASTGARPGRPSGRSPASCWPGSRPTRARTTTSWPARSPPAAPAGARGCSPRCPPTSRPPPGWPSRPRSSPTRPASTSRSGTSSGSPRKASAACSPSAAASASPPRLIRLDYSPPGAAKGTPTVVLVGKGITFDTGGLDIKPPEGMLSMKRDMSGGAAVLATMAALRDVDCPVRVIGLVPAAENADRRFRDAARRRDPPLRRPHQRGQQHRRRGPPGHGRRDGLRRGRAQAPTSWSTSPPSPAR